MTAKKSDILDNKKKWLELYRAPESGGNISTVCHAVGISRDTFYNWIKDDPQFKHHYDELKIEKADDMEQQLYQRGYEKSDVAMIFWLKHNHPTYRETPTIAIQQNFYDKANKQKEEYDE